MQDSLSLIWSLSLSLLFLSLKNIYSWSKSWSGTCRPGFVVAAGLARGNFWEEKKPDQLFPLLAACPGQRPRFCVLFASRSEASASSACITNIERLICPGWEIFVAPVSQPETSAGTKRGLFVPGLATGTKGPFFFCFPFLNSFSITIILLHFN